MMLRAPQTVVAVALLLSAGLILSGCGGADAPDPARVSFSDKVAAGTVENYTDADWLFQNYFGDYGIPEAIKPSFMPAMQMLANGFMLQYKTGQDVRANIEQVHTLFLQYAASGEASRFFAQVQQDLQVTHPTASGPDPDSPLTDPPGLPPISPEDEAQIAAAKLRDQQEQRDIQDIARQHGLPYTIEGIPEQWFVYSPAMKNGGKAGRAGRGSSPPAAAHSAVRRWGLRRGDVLWVNGAGPISGVPGHNAIAYGNGEEVYLIDANTDVGVSVHTDPQRWVERYTEVRALTPKLRWDEGEYRCYQSYGSAYGCARDSYQRMQAWWYAWNKQGAPYNWNFTNPRDQSRMYCSSLVWNAYDSVQYNVIWPALLGNYGLVTPNQLRDSRALVTFKVSQK